MANQTLVQLSLRDSSPALRWLILGAGSAALAFGLRAAGLPAAMLLGPMIAAMLFAAGAQGGLRLPNWPLALAQGVIGCMVAKSLNPATLQEMLRAWPLFIATILIVIGASFGLAWLLARWRILPASAAIWGGAPGGATAMVLMAADFGADVRLVAFMQYLRLVFVAIAATALAKYWSVDEGATPQAVWFPAFNGVDLASTLALIAACAFLVRRLRLHAFAMLLPIGLSAALSAAGLLRIELPLWLLASCYVFVGWNIGLRFTRDILIHAAGAFTRIAAAILTLIALCGVIAFFLARFAGVDALTAYLAASPGGLDTIAIIAANAPGVDLPFVMAMQLARFIIVLLVGPVLARAIVRRL